MNENKENENKKELSKKQNKNKNKINKEDIIWNLIHIVVLIGAIFLMYKSVSCVSYKYNQKNIEKTEIISINLSDNTEGSFVLGIETVKDKKYYVAYKILKDGGKKLVKMPIDKSIIYDILEEDENAYIEDITNGFEEKIEIKIYVPKGTITKEYDMLFE